MDQRFRSILDELSDYAPQKDPELFVESRAQQVIASATHLMKLIRESYDEETAEDLTKRLILSIKNENDDRFRRKIRQVRESREKKKRKVKT